jgi:hypothetical protein
MSVGPIWSKGNAGQYELLETLFNQAKENAPDALVAFADFLRIENTNVIGEQIRLYSRFGPAQMIADYYTEYRRAANNWFGDDGYPMWSRRTKTRPAEIHRVICAAESYLADLLVAGAATCQFFGQCKHHEFEMWITWPPYGFVGEEVRVWLFSPNDYLYTEDDYTTALPRIGGDPLAAGMVEAQVIVAADEVRAAHADLRAYLDDLRFGPAYIRELEENIEDAEAVLLNTAASHPNREFAAFKGTPLAIPYDGGLPVIGDVSVQYFEDFLADPREPRLNQPPEEKDSPAGAPASGVRFRWDRARPRRWPAYQPLVKWVREDFRPENQELSDRLLAIHAQALQDDASLVADRLRQLQADAQRDDDEELADRIQEALGNRLLTIHAEAVESGDEQLANRLAGEHPELAERLLAIQA